MVVQRRSRHATGILIAVLRIWPPWSGRRSARSGRGRCQQPTQCNAHRNRTGSGTCAEALDSVQASMREYGQRWAGVSATRPGPGAAHQPPKRPVTASGVACCRSSLATEHMAQPLLRGRGWRGRARRVRCGPPPAGRAAAVEEHRPAHRQTGKALKQRCRLPDAPDQTARTKLGRSGGWPRKGRQPTA